MRAVILSEFFRPWATAGVTAFLAEEEVDMTGATQAGIPPSPQRSHTALTPGARPGNSQRPPMPSPPDQGHAVHGSRPTQNPMQRESGHTHVPPPAAQTTAPRQASPSSAPSTTAIPPIMQPQNTPLPTTQGISAKTPWPEAFTQIFAKMAPGPVLWTYKELGADLTGQGSPERSAFLRSLIQQLHLPRGTNIFWPHALPGLDEPQLGYRVFAEGLLRLRPKLIIFIGMSSLPAMQGAVSLTIPFTQQLHQGRMHILLPEFSELLNAPTLLDKSCHYLRATLTAVGVYAEKK